MAALLGLGALAASPVVRGQTPPAPKRLGILGISNPAASKPAFDIFADELAKLGWVEGRNLVSIYRFAQGDLTRMDTLAAELVALEPDVIFAASGTGAVALQRATRSIPVVMAGDVDPVALGLVKSLAHPGGNITGVSGFANIEVASKPVQMLKEWLPGLSRLALIYSRLTAPGMRDALDNLQSNAARLGVRVEPLPVRDTVDIEPALAELSRRRPDAVYVLFSPATYTHRETICSRLVGLQLPSAANATQFADAGCLLSYATQLDDALREMARIVDQILRGANPAELPVRQYTRFELVINARTAKALGLTVPKPLLLRADRVIE